MKTATAKRIDRAVIAHSDAALDYARAKTPAEVARAAAELRAAARRLVMAEIVAYVDGAK